MLRPGSDSLLETVATVYLPVLHLVHSLADHNDCSATLHEDHRALTTEENHSSFGYSLSSLVYKTGGDNKLCFEIFVHFGVPK